MSAQTKAFKAPLTLPPDATPGAVLARISEFQTRDKEGDVVLPGSFPEGVRVPIAAYGHNWDALPPGMGEITSDAEAAYFRGNFFLDTPQGQAHHATLKALGALCEWSYSFTIADAFAGEQDGEPTRFIRKFDRIFEATPCLVGVGENTGTLAIKAAHAPAPDPLDAYLAAAATLAVEMQEGRKFSTANINRMRAALDQIDEAAAMFRTMLDGAAPPAASNSGKGRALRFAFDRICARQHGVAV